MTLNDIQRAHLALFSAREAGQGASIEQMQAIAMCIRNRVRQGWHDGDWMKAIENAQDYRAHDDIPAGKLESDNRSFQRFIRDIDEIYFSRRDWEKDPSRDPMPSLDEALGKCCYWMFLNRPIRNWFKSAIIENPQSHIQRTQMGLILFFE